MFKLAIVLQSSSGQTFFKLKFFFGELNVNVKVQDLTRACALPVVQKIIGVICSPNKKKIEWKMSLVEQRCKHYINVANATFGSDSHRAVVRD